jgi:FtsZ-binding cell division protein ZapB
MYQRNMDQLGQKIHEAVEMIAALRAENASLKEKLQELSQTVRQEAKKSEKGTVATGELKTLKEDLRRLKSERTQIRKKVRTALRKLDGIRLADQKSKMTQQDLFGSD